MVRTNKNANTNANAEVVPVVDATNTVVPVKAKKEKKAKETVEAPVEQPVVSAPVSAPVPVVESTGDVTLESRINEFSSKLKQWTSTGNSLRSEFADVVKAIAKEQKNAKKSNRKRRVVTEGGEAVVRKPSGFAKPCGITHELATFLGEKNDVELARTDVTKKINTYIKDNELQSKGNGRTIIPDSKLRKLLDVKDGEELTYFNLQKYLKKHFKSNKVVKATA